MVNQLLNYDAWLSQQEATHKAGFVLAIPNHQSDLPVGLSVTWRCITWSGLAIELKTAKGIVKKAQKQWHLALRERGWRVEVCRSLDEVRALVRECYGVG